MKENIVVFLVILLFVEIMVGFIHIGFLIFNIEFYLCVYWIMALCTLFSCIFGLLFEKVSEWTSRKFLNK